MYQLGTVTFEGLRGFDALQKTREAVYAEIPLMLGKPRLQRTGTALQQVSVTIQLHAAFTDPAADIATLDEFREAGQILPLFNGNGEILGDFVILSIDETVTQTAPSGRTLSAEVKLSLKEFYDPNKLVTLDKAAKQAAFAVGSDKVVPVRLVRPPITTMAVVSQNVTAGGAAGLSAIAQIKQAALAPTQQQSFFGKAKSALDNAKKAYESVKDAANTYANIAAKAPQLLDTVQDTLDNIQTLRTNVAAGDITNALSATEALESSIGSVNSATGPLNAVLILRQPQ